MTLIRHAIAFIAIVATTQILAESPKDTDVSTTGDFIAFCDVSEDDPAYEAAMGFCLGYIDAVMDYHEALTAGSKFDPIACPETKVTREEVVNVLMDWSKRNESHLQNETPVHGIMRSASEKWPCSEQ